MSRSANESPFEAKLLRPAGYDHDDSWAFLVLPKEVSAKLPRRGRTTVQGTINGADFQATLEPDGQLSHWLKVNSELRKAAGADFGDFVTLEIAPVEQEPEPDIPADLEEALTASPAARSTWEATTPLARVDWIHWITTAKRAETRTSRVHKACDMLAAGKKRVCCFDPSGFYSKSLSAPEAVE